MTANDRELLELAAKAAGYKYSDFIFEGESGLVLIDTPCYEQWNPLANRGDALRLVIRCRFTIKIFPAKVYDEGIDCPGFVEVWADDDSHDPIVTEYVTDGNYDAATRRAIVRAAAEIGRNMK